MAVERARPVSDHIVHMLADGRWVHKDEIARSAVGRDNEPLTTVEIARTIHRLRKMGYSIESGSFYRMRSTPDGAQIAQLDGDDDAQIDTTAYVVVDVAQRGRPAQSDGRLSRDKGSEQFHFRPSFYDMLGCPKRVVLIADPKQRIFALKPVTAHDSGRTPHRRADGRKHVEVTVTGLYDALGIQTSVIPTPYSVTCKIRNGMLLCKPYIPQQCAHCAGTGHAK